MRILLIHQNFPGQFRHLAQAWAYRPDLQVVGIGRDHAPGIPGLNILRYSPHRAPHSHQHPYLRQMENAVLHGQGMLRVLLTLKNKGFVPDAIIAHPGWGETLYARDVFPNAQLIHFCEWYYGTPGADLGFDPEFPSTLDDAARVRTWKALHTLNLEQCDLGVSPTHWQWSRHPETHRSRIHVIHEGINTQHLNPDPKAWIRLRSGLTLRQGAPVITYVARNLEPYRGFHVFMRALEHIQRLHPTCHALIVGGDGVSYGRRPKDAPNWRRKMLAEVKLDPTRTHFLGKVPYATYRRILQISAAHVYFTYPFVLSWSALEAMATGCLLIGSRTAPVEEVIQHGHNGLLTDFFDIHGLATQTVEALAEPQRFTELRRQAQQTVRQSYTLEKGIEGYTRLLGIPAHPPSTPSAGVAHSTAADEVSPC